MPRAVDLERMCNFEHCRRRQAICRRKRKWPEWHEVCAAEGSPSHASSLLTVDFTLTGTGDGPALLDMWTFIRSLPSQQVKK
jgi:hypothetical protein